MKYLLAPLTLAGVLAVACGNSDDDGSSATGDSSRCGPTTAVVDRVIDGDTIELESGERVRYLLIDTPESTTNTECYGPEAKEVNRSLVEGKEVTLRYDDDCTDRFDRLLAYVSVNGREVNKVLLERGFACVLYIPPNGSAVVDEYRAIEEAADEAARGHWGQCADNPCND